MKPTDTPSPLQGTLLDQLVRCADADYAMYGVLVSASGAEPPTIAALISRGWATRPLGPSSSGLARKLRALGGRDALFITGAGRDALRRYELAHPDSGVNFERRYTEARLAYEQARYDMPDGDA